VAALPTYADTARAKINLTLHVGPARADGFHSLQSLVVFAEIGDELQLGFSKKPSDPKLSLSGPFSAALDGENDNLILRASNLFPPHPDQHPVFHLVKNLPIASGIGGGSADAAAAARLHCRAQQLEPADYQLDLLNLGADIPVCLASETCLMQGVGENLTPLPCKGQLHAVLVNPGIPVSTAAVFREFDARTGSPELMPVDDAENSKTLLEQVLAGRNDLQTAAINAVPEIQDVLDLIHAQTGCQLARMSGSGGTCFGIFPDATAAKAAATAIKQDHPDWWCVPTMLGDRA
jgi:4-diphosphocytidyl-2-C-methyl-D-erythritol kinase